MKRTSILIILSLLTGCEALVSQPVSQVKKPVNASSSVQPKPSQSSIPVSNVAPSPSPPSDGSGKIQQSGSGNNEIPIPLVTPSPEETSSSSSSSGGSPTPTPSCPPVCENATVYNASNPSPPPSHGPRFDDNRPVSEGIRDAEISVIFKDNYKIRWNYETNIFVSLTNTDVTELNQIIKKYNILVNGYGKVITEEELEAKEKKAELQLGVDIPNLGSIYSFQVKNTNIKELVDTLRALNYVLSSNESAKPVPT